MLRQFAASWTFGGKSNYSAGIKEAFSYFDINETKSQGGSRGKSFIEFKNILTFKIEQITPRNKIFSFVSNVVSLKDRFNLTHLLCFGVNVDWSVKQKINIRKWNYCNYLIIKDNSTNSEWVNYQTSGHMCPKK